ncbi:MAG TPA: bi-domain-containing oxidoreductase [Candidatus Methanoculleus thermohydrogenotrophicum]|jgi:predicted dehydrogenase|nr:bi-domain-containing oxidoreductase [Candidatus Methanoculleus thermohydrogenotrophicum]NLM82072.1 Gfo/Idh/MocA family oxidoreductase [Candidatus Methanoculleus thermohydrogenotrophicum]HOB18709.1 bi-domain-containing oxidoreductase [Candidatus Methanoculleus thermohydrogenotrophicum]HPZ38779.1 bi-domain-containing oxidoreductase [Candidatus Methanoculleus thermohydrogenotrophicum]HQC92121.1 bi-domain-containing oxidoreductase [Candidatus Methanoculleus thermohydrogenotrophicum]
MKQVLLDLQAGSIRVENVPVPAVRRGVVVENVYSLISAGTESSLINLAEQSLIGKAKARPDDVKKVIQKIGTDGPLPAYRQAMSRLSKPEPLGYSCAGTVVKTGTDDFEVGDRVACGGAGYAVHAEYVSVPKNLCVKVPDGVGFREAAFTTVGSIAMHGVRNAKVTVGENVAVIGLGLIGLLVVQILKAAGCRVIGIDIDQEKLTLAASLGADVVSNYDGLSERMKAFSPFGADAVIITAATRSSAPIEAAGCLVRDQGRVVVVGNVGMNVPRDIFYQKEAEVVVSRSYGPGRYDRNYEERGIDYPIYVRWTERRNMEAFLELVRQRKIDLDPLITHTFAVDDAPEAYNLINTGRERYIGVLLQYSPNGSGASSTLTYLERPEETRRRGEPTAVRTLGCIGAGVHALSSLYPHLPGLPVNLAGLATATGLSAHSVAKKYGFSYCTTDYQKILEDPDIDAVLIATRNDLHAPMAIDALRAGKDVFVEKPLAVDIDGLRRVVEAWNESGNRLMVGFNRRHSPLARKMKEFFGNRTTPAVLHYRVNAGQIPPEHWVHDDEQGGGMLISECCHFIDFMQYITGARPVQVYARAIDPTGTLQKYDNFQATLAFDDGSLGTVTYTTLGDPSYPKETVEVFCDNAVGRITDFRDLELRRGGKASRERRRLAQDKGFAGELLAFVKGEEPDFIGSVATTLATFLAWESIDTGTPRKIDLRQVRL